MVGARIIVVVRKGMACLKLIGFVVRCGNCPREIGSGGTPL